MSAFQKNRTNTGYAFITGLWLDDSLPSLKTILELRENVDTMMLFCDTFLPCVVGKVGWKQAKMDRLLSDIVTPSDEAFAFP